MPIRALQIVTRMRRGGLENRLMDIYRHIDRNEVQLDFYTLRLEAGDFDDEIRSLGGRVFYNPPISIRNFFHISLQIAQFLRQHPEYRIVHAHVNAWCGTILRGAKMAGVPVRIAHARTALNYSIKNVPKNVIKLSVNRNATHRFAVSQKAGIWLYGKKAVESGSVKVWPNAIDYRKNSYNADIRLEIRRELNLADKFVLIHVGSHRFEKNHTFLLDVFAKVKCTDASAHLVLVGSGNWDRVRSKAERLGLGNSITFTGPRNDVHRLLQIGDVFVFPSIYEGLPGAVMEAQAAGLPCIISDIITDEVCVTPLVVQLPLALGDEQWARRVLECRGVSRENYHDQFRQSGFDINDLVCDLAGFYKQVTRREGA